MDCTPATSRITVIVEAQPDGVRLVDSASMMVATAPAAPISAIARPRMIATRKGASEKLVARFSHSSTSRRRL